MPGPFAPTPNLSVASEQPLAPVRSTSPIEGIASFADTALRVGGSVFGGNQKGEQKDGSNPYLSLFERDLKDIQAKRDELGEAAGKLAERKVAQKYASFGVDFDQDFQRVYESTTGREFDLYGKDPEMLVLEDALQDERFAEFYRASAFKLGTDADPNERTQYALGQMGRMDFMSSEVARSKQEADFEWTTQTSEAYNGIIDQYMESALGTVKGILAEGGQPSTDDFDRLRIGWSQLDAGPLNRPEGVTEDQFRSVRERKELVTTFIDNLEEPFTSERKVEKIMRAVNESLLSGKDSLSVVDAMLVVAANKNIGSLLDNNPEIVRDTLQQQRNLKLPLSNFGAFKLYDPDGTSSERSRVQAQVEDLSPEQRAGQLNGNRATLKTMKPNDVNTTKGQEQFTEHMSSAAMALSTGGTDDFVSPSFLRDTFSNPNVFQMLERLQTSDPRAHQVVTSEMARGMRTEKIKQQSNLNSLEREITGARWNETSQKYELSLSAEDFPAQSGAFTSFQRDLDKWYAGDLSAAARDSFRKISRGASPGSPSLQVLESGGLMDLRFAVQRRDALREINRVEAVLVDQQPEAFEPDRIEDPNAPVPPRRPQESQDQSGILRLFQQLGDALGVQIGLPDGSRPQAQTEGILGMGGFPESEGPSIGERALRTIGDNLPSLLSSAGDSEPPQQGETFLNSTLDTIVQNEGGFQDDPDDSGNYRPDGTLVGTNFGVTPDALAEFRGVDPTSIEVEDIQNLTEGEAREIFRVNYFERPGLNRLGEQVQAQMFDMSVNHGPSNAVRILQKAAGVEVDGIIGPNTIEASKSVTNEQLSKARKEFYRGIVQRNPSQRKFLTGWLNRADKFTTPM